MGISAITASEPRTGEASAGCTVFIVEDAPNICARLVELVERTGNARVVGQAGTAREAVQGILSTSPRFTLLDYHLRGGTGLEVLRAVRGAGSETVVIVLTNDPDPVYRQACLASGARWFLDKSSEFLKVRDIVAGL